MILTVACLAPETGVLSQTITGLTFEILRLQYLARRLMLKLIVLAQEAVAERALEYPPAMIPDASLALLTNGIRQRADAGVRGQATSPVAHPGLAVVAYGPHHSQPRGEDPGMPHHAVARLQHALDLAAVRAHRQPLQALAEVTEGTALLLLIALVALHQGVARKFG